eukprot:332841-Pyramimonas_sp.AAC.1
MRRGITAGFFPTQPQFSSRPDSYWCRVRPNPAHDGPGQAWWWWCVRARLPKQENQLRSGIFAYIVAAAARATRYALQADGVSLRSAGWEDRKGSGC